MAFSNIYLEEITLASVETVGKQERETTWVRKDGGYGFRRYHREDGKWLDSGYILEGKPSGFADRLVVGQGRKKKNRDDGWGLCLSNQRDGGALHSDREDWGLFGHITFEMPIHDLT